MEWNKENTTLLIEHFKEKRELWDSSSEHFKDRNKKHDAWMDLASKFDTEKSVVEKKMRSLIGQFQRELKKPRSGAGAEEISSKWFGFELLLFLRDKNKVRSTNEAGVSEETLNDKKDSEISNDNDRISSISTQQPSVMQNDKLTLGPSKRPAATPVLVDQQRPTISQINDDEIKYFSHFIASKMMKYSEAKKNAVQRAICDILFKADQNCYEQTPNEMCAKAEADPLNETGSVTKQQPSSSEYNDPIKEYFSDSD